MIPVPSKKTFSLILMISGLLMIATAVVYEALDYPWQLLFAEEGARYEDTLPDPTPVRYDDSFEDAPVLPPPVNTGPAPDPGESEEPAPASLEEVSAGDTHISSGASGAAPKVRYAELGAIKIPKLSVSVNMLEGTDGRQMNYGAGHVTGTALPGARGNCVLSGHRSYFRMHPFRHLDKLQAGDAVVLKAGGVSYTYTVYDTFTVTPDETWVLSRVEDVPFAATLITCTPVIAPTHRIIVRLELALVDGVPFIPSAPAPEPAPISPPEPAPESGPEQTIEFESVPPSELPGSSEGE